MARALIVGCGCRGRLLGERLLGAGWQVRGTSRRADGLVPIEAAGIEAASADPAQPGTLLDLVGDVAVVYWLLGSAEGEEEAVAPLHGERLERLLEKLVDTPVRGFVYEAAGSVPAATLSRGASAALQATERWRLPTMLVEIDPGDVGAWETAMFSAATSVLAQ